MVIYDRVVWILSHVSKNAKVLDIGCVGGVERYGSSRWLHGLLNKVAKEVVGIDIDRNGARELIDREYNVIIADIQSLELARTIKEKFGLFDVVVASEVIEHLSNIGLFLDNVKSLLKANGFVIITTPNAQCIRHLFLPSSHSHDHVVTFTMQLLVQLFIRHGFTILEKVYLFWRPPCSLRERLYRSLSRLSPRVLADTLGVIASPMNEHK
jgi:2-polyprenyl-3-methyl-5-hydroxy-6-metoxy-1,4-benzoquinol methylase